MMKTSVDSVSRAPASRNPLGWVRHWILILVWAVVGLGAAELPLLEPLPPGGGVAPLLPGKATELDPDQRLLAELRRKVLALDQQLASRLRAGGDRLPAEHLDLIPGAEAERLLRDEAWQRLEALLRADRNAGGIGSDVLDRPVGTEERLVRELRAANLLGAAETYRQLAASIDGLPRHRREGAELAQSIDPGDLSDAGAVRLRYLRVWFAVELLRLAQPEERAGLQTEAERHLADLERQHPESLLLRQARELFATMELEARIDAARP